MGSQFNTQFKSTSNNISKYTFSQSNLQNNIDDINTSRDDIEDYGEVEEFDYENYLEENTAPIETPQEMVSINEQEQLELLKDIIQTRIGELHKEISKLQGTLYGTTDIDELSSHLETWKETQESIESQTDKISTKMDELNIGISKLKSTQDEDLYGTPNLDELNSYIEEVNETQESIESLNEEITTLEFYLDQIEAQLLLAPYQDIENTKEYQDYIENYKYDTLNIDYQTLKEDYLYDVSLYIMDSSRGKSQEEINQMLENRENQLDKFAIIEYILDNDNIPDDWTIQDIGHFYPELTEAAEQYMFMSEEQRNLYHYLFNTEGEDAANEYIAVIQDSLNQAEGAYLANQFLETLDLNDEGKLKESLANYFDVNVTGLGDGITTFCSGLANVIENKDTLSVDDYKKMIVLQYLQENSSHLDEAYQFSSSLGNMIPSMTASAVVSLLATPAAGEIVGTSLMGLSAMGNAKHQALVQGNSVLASTIYGIFVGTSEATLGYFLGKIPGLSKESGLTLKNLLSEGLEEGLQEWVDAGLQTVILGQDVDWESIPEQSKDSFLMGVLMAGVLNGGSTLVSLTISGTQYTINAEEVLEIMTENPKMSITDAIKENVPKFLDFLNSKKRKQAKIEKAAYKELESASYANNNFKYGVQEVLLQKFLSGDDAALKISTRAAAQFIADVTTLNEIETFNTLQSIYYDVLNSVGYTEYSVRGIRTIINNRVSVDMQQDMINNLTEHLKVVPPNFLKLINQISFHATFNPWDLYWEKQYKIDNFTSAATGGNGEITVWVDSMISLNTIAHEIAHTYDRYNFTEWGLNTEISNSDVWKNAMKADYQLNVERGIVQYNFSQKIKNSLNDRGEPMGITEYAINSASSVEDFAESVAIFYSDPKRMELFPNRYSLLAQYMPLPAYAKTIYQRVYNVMSSEYGDAIATQRMQSYLQTGDINYITSTGASRELMQRYSIDDFYLYLDREEAQQKYQHFQSVQDSFDLGFGAMIREYGAEKAVSYMQTYLQTGDLNYITQSEGARDSMSQFTIEEYEDVVRQYTGGSLDINKLIDK